MILVIVSQGVLRRELLSIMTKQKKHINGR